MNFTEIQAALRDGGHQAWLFYDHHHRDPIAYHVLGLPTNRLTSRRWFYLIPATGDPVKLVHRIESHHLDTLPGSKLEYSSWEELWANLVARFEATLTEEQIATHYEAQAKIDEITAGAFQEIGRRARNGGTHEFEIQQWILEAFRRENLIAEDPPNVSVGAHSGDPHYEPSSASSAPIHQGDFILLDIWGKLDEPGSVYYDITWTGVIGTPSDNQREVFNVVRDARDVGIHKVKEAFDTGKKICGWEVDKAVHDFIAGKGYSKNIFHRTGHSIGPEIHANGANLDNLETKDDRLILPNTCFSVEPGVYLPDFGVRSEIDMMTRKGQAEVTGRIQNELVLI